VSAKKKTTKAKEEPLVCVDCGEKEAYACSDRQHACRACGYVRATKWLLGKQPAKPKPEPKPEPPPADSEPEADKDS